MSTALVRLGPSPPIQINARVGGRWVGVLVLVLLGGEDGSGGDVVEGGDDDDSSRWLEFCCRR